MAHRDVEYGFKDAYNDSPLDIQEGDRVYYVVVATAGYANDWAAYAGFGAPDEVARGGDKISKEVAEGLFPIMRNTGRMYRD